MKEAKIGCLLIFYYFFIEVELTYNIILVLSSMYSIHSSTFNPHKSMMEVLSFSPQRKKFSPIGLKCLAQSLMSESGAERGPHPLQTVPSWLFPPSPLEFGRRTEEQECVEEGMACSGNSPQRAQCGRAGALAGHWAGAVGGGWSAEGQVPCPPEPQ